MGEFRMPSLGADMEEGILLEWLTKPGASVHRGDVVAVVETPKSAVEVETFEDGVVSDLLVEEGQTVPVGTVLATLAPVGEAAAPAGEAAAPAAPPRPRVAEAAPPVVEAPPPAVRAPSPVVVVEAPPPPAPSPPAAPAVPRHPRAPAPPLRHRAHQLGVDLGAVHGTGPDGIVTRADVERAARVGAPRRRVTPLARRLAAQAGIDLAGVVGTGTSGAVRADDVRRVLLHQPAPAPAPPVPDAHAAEARATDMRRSIAALMSRSNRDIPHYHLTLTIDVQAAVDWVHARNRELPMGRQLVPAALLLLATARAAREVPELNGYWVDDGFRPAKDVDLGLILSLRGGGLLVPTIPAADGLDVESMMARIRELTTRARAGRLRGSDLAPPTISVSNLGDQGADTVAGVIYPPQVALVGFGAVRQRPWAVHGLLGVRSLVTATLSGDHRATDGSTGARLLRVVDRLLQRPEEL
ncbi:dihydrolipoamide acetyltransferase family protein [Pedococcus sp. NPDC057267]|uniref:dihydrolipoamide acetyltransferase family protein n=1 Tax=Pedococcus sp. NPDC057267 TaxID=3346077 RepID=UPI003624CF93